MKGDRLEAVLALVALAILPSCTGDVPAASAAAGPIVKGGDGRLGQYTAVGQCVPERALLAVSPPSENCWWKAAPDHVDGWTWGSVSGLVADHADRIVVGITGDRNADGGSRPRNYIVAVNGNGDIVENWTQWDTMVAFPHQLYIDPYDPERHIWIVDRGGGGARGIHEQVFKFTNDGKQLVMRVRDPNPRQTDEEVLANQPPGPLDFGQASTLAFLPNGDFLLGDGYQNGRIVRFSARGEFISDFGSIGSGPGQFNLVHGVAVDRDNRIYVSDRDNNRIQIFTEAGELIEEWPDIVGPTGIYIDEREHVWVLSTTLNGISEYDLNGQLMQHFGGYCCTRGGFLGGFSRPHQMSVDEAGNIYVANFDDGYVTKLSPKPGADPNLLVGGPLVVEN
jgi:sugar lactone lactonase YvrE